MGERDKQQGICLETRTSITSEKGEKIEEKTQSPVILKNSEEIWEGERVQEYNYHTAERGECPQAHAGYHEMRRRGTAEPLHISQQNPTTQEKEIIFRTPYMDRAVVEACHP